MSEKEAPSGASSLGLQLRYAHSTGQVPRTATQVLRTELGNGTSQAQDLVHSGLSAGVFSMWACHAESGCNSSVRRCSVGDRSGNLGSRLGTTTMWLEVQGKSSASRPQSLF